LILNSSGEPITPATNESASAPTKATTSMSGPRCRDLYEAQYCCVPAVVDAETQQPVRFHTNRTPSSKLGFYSPRFSLKAFIPVHLFLVQATLLVRDTHLV
jgi:hypothetical protein